MVGGVPSMVRGVPSTVGVVPSMVGEVPSMVGEVPSMVGEVPSTRDPRFRTLVPGMRRFRKIDGKSEFLMVCYFEDIGG